MWAIVAALVLGGLAALLPTSAHVHGAGQGSWAHHHFFAGPHIHPLEEPSSEPAGTAPPLSEPDTRIVALATALSLGAGSPALHPAQETPFRPLAAPAPALPRGVAVASPFSPRGPPALLC